MRIIREISSSNPEKCRMVAKGLFGRVKGEVKYSYCTDKHFKGVYGITFLNDEPGYFVMVNGDMIGAASDFHAACDMLLQELGVFKTVCV
jgi:hypothetical protein